MEKLNKLTTEAENKAPVVISDDCYLAGTLKYTKSGLVQLFLWLLWGDFCFTLLPLVSYSVLPLKLKSLNASNTLIGLLSITVPMIFSILVCPAVSCYSDRYRSKFGRRIPFMMISTPFITVFLLLLGFSDSIAKFIALKLGLESVSTVTIFLIAIFTMGFWFFNIIISSIYYYLFNDVVPVKFMARFLSLFRIVGAAAGLIFNLFVFKYAETYMREIFVSIAVLYFITFIPLCFKVKEGKYPPPPPHSPGGSFLLPIKRFFVECFSIRHYGLIFLASTFCQMQTCVSAFAVFYYKSLGLSLDQIGTIVGYSGILTAVVLYPAGILSDRFHPLRVLIVGAILLTLITTFNFIFLISDFSLSTNYNIIMLIIFLSAPVNALIGTAELPVYMRLFPKESFGQFCSANALLRSFGTMAGVFLAGMLMDKLSHVYNENPFYYRYISVWTFVCLVLYCIFLIFVIKSWKRHGGPDNYIPPVVA